MNHYQMSHSEMLELRRWNTPTIYNGWEQITKHDVGTEAVNLEPVTDFMPQMGAMVGRAITIVVEPGNPIHKKTKSSAWSEYRSYIASIPGPKIVIVQDLDKPNTFGSFWGEVNSNVHRALGCVGTIVDGAIRDVDEMTYAGFKALARRMCVGHAYNWPVQWGGEVEVFGRKIQPGQLIHADKHGFIAIPPEDEQGLLDASRFMDSNECKTVIDVARTTCGQSIEEMLAAMNDASARYRKAMTEKFSRGGEF
ncbi:MAG: RraA family protein [Acidobacteria bacterium]|nr:RraA family protein [Acidobacteriota bacterium]